MNAYRLTLSHPATEWENATPIGNAYMGAMVFGGVCTEHLELNEERIWAGNEERNRPTDTAFREKLDLLRELLQNGKGYEADVFSKEQMTFKRIQSYESAGELFFDFGEADYTEYRRDLDVINGVAEVSYRVNGKAFTRTYFASYPKRCVAVRFATEVPGGLTFRMRYERENVCSKQITPSQWTVYGKTACGTQTFAVHMHYVTNGTVTVEGDTLSVTGADYFQLLIAAKANGEPSVPTAAYDDILAEHCADFSSYMKRCDIVFDTSKDDVQTDDVGKRLARYQTRKTDNGLVSLYYQFGRYLLLSSSRPGSLPANLQGVWSHGLESPWNADYHTNINLQMNYWPAEVTNLSECAQPLFDYINDNCLEQGKVTANLLYRCRGTVLHHVSDIYGFTQPADGPWGLWPLGGAWLCYHLWEHWLYTQDEVFLREKAYPYIAESVQFFLDYLFEKDGYLLSGPSTSPENSYLDEQGRPVFLCLSPAMDREIIGGLFRFYIEAEQVLHLCPERAQSAKEALEKLPPLTVGKNGCLCEWMGEPEEYEVGHRHISHLFALYPDCAISEKTPEWFAAAEKTIQRRLSGGGGHTGWSAAWLFLLYARLHKGKQAENALRRLLSQSTLENLFDSHPPFQIDGNFGGCAGIAECVLQSHNGIIALLPAVADEFATGHFFGLMARGGVEVSAAFRNGVVTAYTLHATRDYDFTLRCNGTETKLSMKAGQTITMPQN